MKRLLAWLHRPRPHDDPYEIEVRVWAPSILPIDPPLSATEQIIAERMIGAPISLCAEDAVRQVLLAAGPLITLNEPNDG